MCGFLLLGNLRNGSNSGLAYLNVNNGLGNANWNILTRLTSEQFVMGVLRT